MRAFACTAAAVLLQLPALAPAQQRDFAVVDAHADRAPATVRASVADLAAYLAEGGGGGGDGGGGGSDLERTRAIYRWLTTNIEYHVEGLLSGDYGDVSPAGVLNSGRAVCTGYANLARALGQEMGLEVEVVNGWSKGYGYAAGQTFEGETNHAWNAVKVDGEWRLMDPTWGAGYLNDQQEFVHRFQEHYFLTDPEDFIFDHLPVESEWQLLERPVSGTEYADLVYLRPAFFLYGLGVRSHQRVKINTDDRVTVTLGAPNDVMLTAQLLDAASGRRLDKSLTFVQVVDGEARIDAAFPRPGEYVLRLFARRKTEEGRLRWALDYRVTASSAAADAGFPTAYRTFVQSGAVLYEPMEGTLSAGKRYHFKIKAPGALEAAIVIDGRWTHLQARGDVFEGDVHASAGDLIVYAKYERDANFTGLLKYVGR